MIKYLPLAAMLLLLAGCSGVYVGVPIGPVSVGTTVGKEGPKSVSAGVGVGPAGASVSAPVKKEKAFEDSPQEYDDLNQDAQSGTDSNTKQ